jgi:hypothetical protein
MESLAPDFDLLPQNAAGNPPAQPAFGVRPAAAASYLSGFFETSGADRC